MTTSTPSPAATGTPDSRGDFSLDVECQTIGGAFRDYIGRLRTGNPGALPSALGLVLLVVVFSQISDGFLSRYNIGSLPGQGASYAIIGMGLVFVLLLGEIDLSAGTTGGVAAGFAVEAVYSGNLHQDLPATVFWTLAVVMIAAIGLGVWLKAYSAAAVALIGTVLLLTNQGQHVIGAMAMGVCIGAAVGIFNGYLVAKVGIPSFVATLAIYLAFQGVLLFALNRQSKGVLDYPLWFGLTSPNKNLSPALSWVFTVVVVGGYAVYSVLRSQRAARAGLARDGMALVGLRVGVLAVVAAAVTIYANEDRGPNRYLVIHGLPYSLVVVLVLMIVCTLALTKTSWGRHLYAVGGNAEAARRAGIDVVHIKVTAFALCSGFGALGGMYLASNAKGVPLNLGTDTLLFAVAAAVIGGTSLFGGRGRPSNAVIGALVIVIIPNGLQLKQNLGPEYQEVITGVVLLAAAGVDALSRKRAARS